METCKQLNGKPYAVVLATLVCGITGTVFSQTIGWWGFEGTPGQTAEIGTVFPNRIDASRLPAEVYARYDGAASTDYQPVFDSPIFEEPYGIGDSTMAVASRSSLRFTNQNSDGGRSQGCPVRIQDSNGALELQTFSLEGWFKMDQNVDGWRAIFAKGYGPMDGSGYAYTYALYADWGVIKAHFTVKDGDGKVRYLKSVAFSGGTGQRACNDGNWHYISLVVNGTTHKANFFCDLDDSGAPKWIGAVDLGGELVYNSAEPLVIGGSNLSDWQFPGSVDEVRLSDVIVNTARGVLRKNIPNGMVIGHFPMEGDCKSTVWANYWTDPVMSAATGGEMPTFTDREKEMVYCDNDGGRIGKAVDKKCLTLNKGKVRWQASELLKACEDSLTVEFFVNAKGSENENWAGIIRSAYEAESKTWLPWNLSYTTDFGYDLFCRVDTETSWNRSSGLKYAKVPFDGEWHHLALQIWREDDYSTSFALYVDYKKQEDSGIVDGKTIYPDGTYWGFGLADTPFIGRVDEVRLTKGVIPVDDFMRLRYPKGMIVSLR